MAARIVCYLLAVLLLALVGCTTAKHKPAKRAPAPSAVQIQRAAGASLINHGVNVIQLGDEITLVVPADRVFYWNAPRVKPSASPLLSLVADYLRSFEKVDIKVAVYTDNQGDSQRNQILSRNRAANVVAFLWEKQLDARLLAARGYGEAHPIVSNQTAESRRINRRIEISVRQITDSHIV